VTSTTTTITVVNDVLLDHPGWRVSAEGKAYRAVRSGHGIYVVSCSPSENLVRTIRVLPRRGAGWQPVLDLVDPEPFTGTHTQLASLHTAGPIERLRNPDLWDALAWAILRKAPNGTDQIHYSYLMLGRLLGDATLTPAGATYLFPCPEIVIHAADDEFGSLNMGVRRTLRTAARSFLTAAPHWYDLAPRALLAAVQRIPGVGPHTAGLTVADYTNETTLIPVSASRCPAHHRIDRVAAP
jgi:DNA-3-methyladenine glycosylase II